MEEERNWENRTKWEKKPIERRQTSNGTTLPATASLVSLYTCPLDRLGIRAQVS